MEWLVLIIPMWFIVGFSGVVYIDWVWDMGVSTCIGVILGMFGPMVWAWILMSIFLKGRFRENE